MIFVGSRRMPSKRWASFVSASASTRLSTIRSARARETPRIRPARSSRLASQRLVLVAACAVLDERLAREACQARERLGQVRAGEVGAGLGDRRCGDHVEAGAVVDDGDLAAVTGGHRLLRE